jgi:hypothetical protein
MTPAVAGQAGALRAAAAFTAQRELPGLRVTASASAVLIEVPRAAGGGSLGRRPGPWQETVTATGRISGFRAVITTVIHDEDAEQEGAR